jgi:hypothetical protein
LGNIDAFADVYLTSQNPASLGVILTNWVPSRHIQNSLWDGFAYAAVAFNRGSDAARSGAFRNFVQRHWAAPRLAGASNPATFTRRTHLRSPKHTAWPSPAGSVQYRR